MHVLICGGGVIGTSIAYFLSLRSVKSTVIERTGVANAASGKSGGFLALDWCDGSPVEPLARRSFELHDELANSIDDAWGYRRLDTLNVVASTRRDVSAYRQLDSPDWLGRGAAVHTQLGSQSTTAQVDPAAFTKGMMRAAMKSGAQLLIGNVTGLTFKADGATVRGAMVDGREIAGDSVVIAMGPWSVLASQWLPLPAVYGLKGHSLVFQFEPPMMPHALFVELETESGGIASPEVIPRDDGTTYVCGLSSEAPLPVDPVHVVPDDGGCEELQAMTAAFAPQLGKAEVLAAQACYRPIVQDGLPLMGAVPGISGAYVATGHSVWGMLNGPATGEAMTELIIDGATRAVDISPFRPERLAPLEASDLHAEP
tara:strand:- start:3484 stop:4596 length:1113 start_codon:yes stop_codon:yes gene_type:complete